MEKIKTQVFIDIRAKVLECNITAKKVQEETEISAITLNNWMKNKAPDLIVGIFKQAKFSKTEVDVLNIGIENNTALDFIKKCKKLYGWEFMEIVKESKL